MTSLIGPDPYLGDYLRDMRKRGPYGEVSELINKLPGNPFKYEEWFSGAGYLRYGPLTMEIQSTSVETLWTTGWLTRNWGTVSFKNNIMPLENLIQFKKSSYDVPEKCSEHWSYSHIPCGFNTITMLRTMWNITNTKSPCFENYPYYFDAFPFKYFNQLKIGGRIGTSYQKFVSQNFKHTEFGPFEFEKQRTFIEQTDYTKSSNILLIGLGDCDLGHYRVDLDRNPD